MSVLARWASGSYRSLLGAFLGQLNHRVLNVRRDDGGAAGEDALDFAEHLAAGDFDRVSVGEHLVQMQAFLAGFDLGNVRLRLMKALGDSGLPQAALFAQLPELLPDLFVSSNIHAFTVCAKVKYPNLGYFTFGEGYEGERLVSFNRHVVMVDHLVAGDRIVSG